MANLTISKLIATLQNTFKIGKATIDASGVTTNKSFALPDSPGTLVIGGGTASGTNTGDNAANSNIPYKNWAINSNFNVWQRATSQTANNYLSCDAWYPFTVGSTKVFSRQAFTLGQTAVPGNPKYYLRTVVTSVAGVGNICTVGHRIEGVKSLSGGYVTISFCAKADASKSIGISMDQSFGTGGSPSAYVSGAGIAVPLISTWTNNVVTLAIPSIAGKTIGTDGNDYIELIFWFDAGSNYNTVSGSIGQHSGTFDISRVKIEEGTVATPYEDDEVSLELAMCKRRYQTLGDVVISGYNLTAGFLYQSVSLPVTMRAVPTAALTSTGTFNCNTLAVDYVTDSTLTAHCKIVSTNYGYQWFTSTLTADL